MAERTPTVAEATAFFLEEYEAAAPEIEATDRIPDRLLRRAADIGVYRLTVPQQYGGWELGILEFLPYLEAAAMGPGSGRMLMHLTNGIWRPLHAFGTPAQQALISRLAAGEITLAFCLTERSGGTGRDLHSHAVWDGEQWRLTGEKHLITFADRADYFLLIARNEVPSSKSQVPSRGELHTPSKGELHTPGKGELHTPATGEARQVLQTPTGDAAPDSPVMPGTAAQSLDSETRNQEPGTRNSELSFTAFLVPRDTPGFEIDLSQPTMGLHGTGHGFLRYADMPLDDSARLGKVGQGLDVAFYFLDYSRVSLSACMVGHAQRALDEAVAFARRRVTFGRPIAERQAIQMHLADMYADVNAGRGLVRMAAERCARGEALAVDAATAKLFCLNMVGRVTDLALRVHGGYGYTMAAPIERLYRDARGFWFEEGTAEIQQLVIARHLLAD